MQSRKCETCNRWLQNAPAALMLVTGQQSQWAENNVLGAGIGDVLE